MGRYDGTTAPDEGEGEEGWEPQVETCRIVLWRGYRKSSFYVRPDGDAPETSIGAPSTSFRRHGSAPPGTPEGPAPRQGGASPPGGDGRGPIGGGGGWDGGGFAPTPLVPAPP